MKALKILRAERGLTGTALGKLSGVRREEISRIEHGHFSPSAPTMKKLAGALGVSVRDIYLLQEQLDAPKAGAREAAANWLEQQGIGHSYLALTDQEALDTVAGASSLEEVAELKEAVELGIIESFLKHHDPEPGELREALELATRKHLHWLIDLEKRRKTLRDEQSGGERAVLVGAAMTE